MLESLASREEGLAFTFDEFDWGGDYYLKHGRMMPEDGREQIRNHDAILFGSAGHPDIPDHITLWGLRLPICQGFEQYANVRPTRILPGIPSPLRGKQAGDLDAVYAFIDYCFVAKPAGMSIDGGSDSSWGGHGYNSAVLGADKHASAQYAKVFGSVYPGNSLANLWPWPKEPQWYADVRTEFRNKFVNA